MIVLSPIETWAAVALIASVVAMWISYFNEKHEPYDYDDEDL